MFVSPEIDCRGQTVDEGIGNIDKYIDDAFLAGLKQVTIIHGKGTGVLRAAVQQYLARTRMLSLTVTENTVKAKWVLQL